MTAMRSPFNRSLLSFRFGVFVLFFVESFISIILSGGNLVHKAASPVSIDYNLLLVAKSVLAFMWMTVIVAQEIVQLNFGSLIPSVWCEITWVSIFSVTEFGGGIILLQESLHPGSFCALPVTPRWNICHATIALSGISLVTGVLLTIYFFILAFSSIHHSRKYPVFHLLCSVREFNWYPAAGSDQIKMSYDSSIESFPSSQHIRGTSRGNSPNMIDLERTAPLTAPRSSPPNYSSSAAQQPRRANPKSRPPPLKLTTSNSVYSSPVHVAPISFVVEPQRVLYPQRPLANTYHGSSHRGPQFGANYI